ncbi:MAG: DEAD/DEAH box helicase family protein [Zetaproteobacteria bacterium]|nr:DEAD/DEAH box helicase family protein [Zetaproteobacteria bacterium]
MNQNPEQKARDQIDRMLAASGWVIQDKSNLNPNASLGVAVREYPTDVGPADYALFVDRKAVGVIEAKRAEEGYHLLAAEDQAEGYAGATLKWVNNREPLPFIYESNSLVTRFRDMRDPKPRSRPVFSFHRPETLQEWLTQPASLRSRLQNFPTLPVESLRDCQISAITNLESSFKQAHPRALVQMATGSGKTYTAITAIYRLLKFAGAKRILFLVDTKNLGEQAEQEFMAYLPNDDNRKFTELYNVQRLKSSYVPADAQVCISTIQRLYSILKGEEMNDSNEKENPAEHTIRAKEPLPVIYNEKIPLEFFDFIVIDECHRSIYNLWKQVLDYYDSFLVGLTATPDKRTFGFFNENVVSEYSHEDAVADGVNVGHDVYLIETEVTTQGGELAAKEFVDLRDKLTREQRWTQLDEDVEYTARQLDKDVVNPSQIRNIIRTFKNKWPEIFPGRKELPKTLIFAKTDSHADDIIRMVRDEFGEGNEFCKKITYQTEEDPKSVLSSFRNDFNPRIAVTVDMIATGTDVKVLECLLFMRDVKSKGYFEQMKGRGTRTIGKDDLQKVSKSAEAKTHFVIVDAIGVTKSLKTDSRPLERKPTVPLKDLLYGVMMGASDEDTVLSLANRLTRLSRSLNNDEQRQIMEKSGGVPLDSIVRGLLESVNPDLIEAKAHASGRDYAEVQSELVKNATHMFSGDLNSCIEGIRRSHEQIIDTVNMDEVTFAGWGEQDKEQAEALVQDFAAFMEEHKDEIKALSIFYNQPHNRRELTFAMIREVLDILKRDRPSLMPSRVWMAYEKLGKTKVHSPKEELMALVSLIRHICAIDAELTPFDATVRRNFQSWVMQKQRGNAPKFNAQQMAWLHMIRDHVTTSYHIDRDDLEYAPFDAKGGLGRMHQLFGDEMDTLLDEMNEALAA